MQVTLYSNFSKRENSTKQPTSIVGITKDLKLKDSCSRIRPSFFIADVRDFTYLMAWGNYYFIRNSAFDINGAQYIDCELDYLATWKNQITNTRAFVLYSSSNYDEMVIDNRIAQRENVIKTSATAETNPFSQTGCYLLSTANSTRGVCNYMITEAAMNSAIKEIASNDSLWTRVKEFFGDAIGAVTGLRYVPFSNFADTEVQPETITLGDYSLETAILNAYYTKGDFSSVITLPIPWYYSDFRRNRNYTKITLELPFIGVVELDTKDIVGNNTLRIYVTGNAVSGTVNYSVSTNEIIATYSGSLGRDIPISADVLNAIGIAQGALTQGGALLGGIMATTPAGEVAAMGALIAGVAETTMSSHKHNFQTIGGYSGGYGERIIPEISINVYSTECRTDPTELLAIAGRPCYKILLIGNLTGYVQTIGFSVELDTYTDARNVINRLMDTGVYLE